LAKIHSLDARPLARPYRLMRGECPWEAREGQVAVKIVDVLDEEWLGVVESLKH
jgi:hypothetical protein